MVIGRCVALARRGVRPRSKVRTSLDTETGTKQTGSVVLYGPLMLSDQVSTTDVTFV